MTYRFQFSIRFETIPSLWEENRPYRSLRWEKYISLMGVKESLFRPFHHTGGISIVKGTISVWQGPVCKLTFNGPPLTLVSTLCEWLMTLPLSSSEVARVGSWAISLAIESQGLRRLTGNPMGQDQALWGAERWIFFKDNTGYDLGLSPTSRSYYCSQGISCGTLIPHYNSVRVSVSDLVGSSQTRLGAALPPSGVDQASRGRGVNHLLTGACDNYNKPASVWAWLIEM